MKIVHYVDIKIEYLIYIYFLKIEDAGKDWSF